MVVVVVVSVQETCTNSLRDNKNSFLMCFCPLFSFVYLCGFVQQCISYLLVDIMLIPALFLLFLPFVLTRALFQLSFILGNLSNGNDDNIALTTLTQLKHFFVITTRYTIIHEQLSLTICLSCSNCITSDAVIIKK